jgi:predicted F0F1-ATPase subunit
MKRADDREPERLDIILEKSGNSTRYKKRLPVKSTGGLGTSWYYLGLVGDIGFTIAIPIALGAIVGNYIDRHLATYPNITLFLLVLGIVISVVGFIKKIQELIKAN